MRSNFLDKMSTQIKVTLMISLLVGVASSSRAATSIGTSFVGRGATPADVLAPGETAGAVPQSSWNNIYDDGSTFKGSAGSLSDSAANFTGVILLYDCSDSWN